MRQRFDLSSANGQALTAALRDRFGTRVSKSEAALQHHGEDEAYHNGRPDLVFYPLSALEVSEAMALCARFDAPVVAWGAGTSLEGNALAPLGGVCFDLSQMNEITDIDAEDLTVTVQAGVRRLQLNEALKGTGLFFPIDPGADATLGGMAATRASGTAAVKYGTMDENVLACRVVLANGDAIGCGGRAPKSAAGYNLTSLMVGSEGTLGIITELTLRLHPIPEATRASVWAFPSIRAAVESVIEARQSGLDLARLELLDFQMMQAINAYQKTEYALAPTLFVELHGTQAHVLEQEARFGELAVAFDGRLIGSAILAEERSTLWKARHNALYATRALEAGKRVLITDVCVPLSKLTQCILETRQDLDASRLKATIAGHVGDGNFHAFILLDSTVAADVLEAEGLHHRMARRAIALGGTCTGEHGIGIGKRGLLREEMREAVDVMAVIKSALDPQHLLNPGKIFLGLINVPYRAHRYRVVGPVSLPLPRAPARNRISSL